MSATRHNCSSASIVLAVFAFPVLAVLPRADGRPPASQPAAACRCQDTNDILYRIIEATAAMNAFKNEIAQFEATERSSGSPVMFSTSAKADLKARVQAVLDGIRQSEPSSPDTAAAETDPHSCNVELIKPGTACLAGAVRRHEDVHEARCSTLMKKKGVLERLSPFSDYRDGMRLADYAQEEIEAYQVEIAYLRSDLRRLPASCRAQGWSGVIVKTETKKLQITGSGMPGRDDSGETTNVYKATMKFAPISAGSPQEGLVTASVDYEDWGRTVWTAEHNCVYGRQTYHVESSGSSSGSGTATYTTQVSWQKTQKGVSFRFQEKDIDYVRTGSVKGNAQCGHPATSLPTRVKAIYPAGSARIDVKADPDSFELVSGSDTTTFPDPFHTTVVYTWTLMRVVPIN